MKICVIQPLYSTDYARSDELFQWQLDALDACDDSLDLIVLPEATDVPALAKTVEQFHQSHENYTAKILEKSAETARRCHSLLFVNAL